jgi:transcriptional regulator with XRE-family HTH domain
MTAAQHLRAAIDADDEECARLMREARELLGLTQSEMASFLRVTGQAYVSKYERGVRRPSRDKLELAAMRAQLK